MGNESSVLKSRIEITFSPSDGSVPLRIRYNYHPLQFHQVHGENIKLMKHRSIACRHEGFCKGIVFSDRPVLIYERIYVKFIDISSNWSGALRIGFTMHDPVTLKSKLPRYACPDLTSMQGNWAKAIAERMAKKDSVLYYYVDQGGDVHYGIDSEEHGIFFGGVNTSGKLWAVLDIYGNTLAIEFIEPSLLNQGNSNELENNLISLPMNNEIQRISSECVIPNSVSRLVFHPVHGRNVILSPTRYIASKKAGTSSLAYVFTEHPLKINQKIEITILKVEQHSNGSMFYGITSCNPSTILSSSLPVNTDDLLDRPEYWVVREDTSSYKCGDVIHFSVNQEGEAVVVKNNQKSAVFHVDPSQPLWLFLNLSGLISEVYFSGSISTEEAEVNRLMENCTVSASAHTSLPSSEETERLAVSAPGPSNQQTFTECVICYEEPVNCALYRCGHICMCYKCACQVWKPRSKVQCPICRETIQDVIKIYI